MNLSEKIRNYLQKLQGLPEDSKKTIIWITAGIIAFIMGFLWFIEVKVGILEMGKEISHMKMPQIDIQYSSLQEQNINTSNINTK